MWKDWGSSPSPEQREISDLKAKVIKLETWLQENCDTTQYDLHGYDLNVNSVGRGKGIATYSRNEFISETNISRTDIQITKVKSNKFTVINTYRSEGCDELETLLSSLITDPENTIVCGDMNIDLKKTGQKQKN